MPTAQESLMEQLNTAKILNPDKNYEPLRLVVQKNIGIDGSTPADVDVDLADFVAQIANCPVASIAVFEVTLEWGAATIENDTFGGETALTNGIDIKMVKGSTEAILGNIKNNLDFFDVFDEVTITTDTKATTPNHKLKARLLFTEQDGVFQHLVAAADALRVTVNDNLTALNGVANLNGHGYGFVAT